MFLLTMEWDSSDRRSDNVEDRRGRSIGRGAAIGGGSVVIALVLALVGAPKELIQAVLSGGGPGSGTAVERPIDPAEAPVVDMVKVILADTEDVWQKVLGPGQYRAPRLVLFPEEVESACGLASAAVGPFYCPGDQQVYLSLSFFRELETRFGAPGNFAQAYVIAHEIGHHVQTLTGVAQKVQSLRAHGGSANKLSVRQELQADCYAGLWAHHTARMKAKRIVAGDIDRGLAAAAAIGDDTLQKKSRGVVVPESFTHGSSAQRVEWFKRGFTAGTMDACDTFDAEGI